MHDSSEAPHALCLKFDSDLPAYFEGEDRPELISHAEQCPYCSVVLADVKLIQSQSREALWEDPPARLWANIRATLASEGVFREPSAGRVSWLPQTGLLRYALPFAALASMVLFCTLVLFPPPSMNRGTNPASARNEVKAPLAEVRYAADNGRLEQTVSEMEKSYRARERSFDPAVQARYQKGLQSLDDSIRECKDSVQKEPDNMLAQEYLATAYQQKAEVLSAALEYDGR